MHIAICFDGQGKHDVRVVRKWIKNKPEILGRLQEIQKLLSFDLEEIAFDGCKANQLDYMQTLSFIWNQILFEYYIKKIPFKPAFAFGHSLGHYNALVSAGVLSFEEALQVVEERSSLVARGFSNEQCGMLHVKYSDVESFARLNTLCQVHSRLGRVLEISIHNSKHDIVVSYFGYSVQEAREALKEFSLKPLAVQAPYHSSAMETIGTDFYRVIEPLRPKTPQIPVLSNVTARPISEFLCKKDLMLHLTCPLFMDACMQYCVDQEVNTIVHLSLSNIVPTLLELNCPECSCYHLADPKQEQAFFLLTEDHNRNVQEEYRKLLGGFSAIAGLPNKKNIDFVEIHNAMTAYQNLAGGIGSDELAHMQKLYGQACEAF
ncbi:MAG: acyltransferase domain-containing protein [Clostridiales bacterium]|nr:acyltransferase domain-containing protein [Clostridiales bacterium]